MSSDQILTLVIGIFLVIAGTIFMVELRKLKEIPKIRSLASLIMITVGVLISAWSFSKYLDSKILIENKSSKLFGEEAYSKSNPKNSGSHEDASRLYERAVSYWNADMVGYDSMDVVMSYFDRSISVYETAEAYTARGQLKVQLGLMQEALSDYNRSIELKDNFGNAYYNRATVYYIMGNLRLACEDWKKANDLGMPNTEDVLNSMCN